MTPDMACLSFFPLLQGAMEFPRGSDVNQHRQGCADSHETVSS